MCIFGYTVSMFVTLCASAYAWLMLICLNVFGLVLVLTILNKEAYLKVKSIKGPRIRF